MKKITIAIDGFSSCGKSTMAKDLAKEIGYIYIDSGAMYRAVTLYCIKNGLFSGDEINIPELERHIKDIHITFKLDEKTQLPRTYLNGEDVEEEIRTMEVSSKVSPVSAIGFVRSALVSLQQEMGKEKGIVMDGRDIGTTVFPEAELKIYVTASPDIRALRRYDELQAKGQKIVFEEILNNVKERDYIDQHREISPLKRAKDAILLDNSLLTIEEQKEWLLKQFEKATQQN
jgi:cytidylate kinase